MGTSTSAGDLRQLAAGLIAGGMSVDLTTTGTPDLTTTGTPDLTTTGTPDPTTPGAPAPPGPTLGDTLTALTKVKRTANAAWLRKLGRGFWGVLTVLVAALLLSVYSSNAAAPLAASSIDRVSADLKLQVEEIRVLLLAGESSEVVAPAVDAASLLAEELTAAGSQLPQEWNGYSLASVRLELKQSASTIRDELTKLDAPNASGTLGVTGEQSLSSIDAALAAVERLDSSPGYTNPWAFDNPAATGFFFASLATYLLLILLSLLTRGGGGLRWWGSPLSV